MAPTVSLTAAVGKSQPWSLGQEWGRRRKAKEGTVSPVRGYIQFTQSHAPPQPCGPQSPEILSGGQTLWAASPSCFVPQRNILKDRGESLGLASTLPARGRTATGIPPLLAVYWWCTKSHCWCPGTQAPAEGKAQGPSDTRGASQKQLPRELRSAASHVHPK